MDEVSRPAPNLPDSFVRISPDLGEIVEDHRADCLASLGARNATLAGLKQGVGDFAYYVELELLISIVADADRR